MVQPRMPAVRVYFAFMEVKLWSQTNRFWPEIDKLDISGRFYCMKFPVL